MSPFKITLNADALERLIGGNTEFELELRNSIVQQFVTKHLKALATSEVMHQAKQSIYADIGANLKTYSLPDSTVRDTVNSKLKNLIDDYVNIAIKDFVDDQYKTIVDNLLTHIDRRVHKEVSEAIPKNIDQIIKDRIMKALEIASGQERKAD